jgi:chitin disaccharide deacetylase
MKRASNLFSRSLLVILLTCGVYYAQVKSVAERLGYPPNSKLLIILADDVGVYHAANLASFTALNQRAVTSGTVMQTSPWLTEVAAYAKQHPDISLGVHLTLCSEYNTFRWGRWRRGIRCRACSIPMATSFRTVPTL